MDRQKQTELFNEIVDRHSGLVSKVCYMYADDGDHFRDLYQEVMANVWQGLAGFKGNSKMSTWVYRVAINTCITFVRRHSFVKQSSDMDMLHLAELTDDSQEHAQLLREMYEMIGLLGKIDKAIIMLWLDEYSYDEIAAFTGMSRNNVASRIHRIKSKLVKQNI